MGRQSRDKGKRGELEVVHVAQANGFPNARRQGDAGQDDRDIAHVEPAYLEVRCRGRLDLPAWIREVGDACPPGLIPVIAYRRVIAGRRLDEPWQASMPLDVALRLIASANNGKDT